MKNSLAARRMIASIIVISLICIAAGVIAALSHQCTDDCSHLLGWIEPVPFALGVALMSALNVAKVFLIERTVNKTVEIENTGAGKTYIRLQYFLRFFLTGVVLVIAAVTDFIDIWGAVAGVFTFQIAAFSLKFMKLDEPENNSESKINSESEIGEKGGD
jgi:hypothetical protein